MEEPIRGEWPSHGSRGAGQVIPLRDEGVKDLKGVMDCAGATI
jgi:hypothetical protein